VQPQPERGQDTNESLVDQVVQQIRRWRLDAPAVLFLEVTKPLSFLASQGLLLCEPLLGSLVAKEQVTVYAQLLADRSSLERLIARLEEERPAGSVRIEEKR